jgi:ppGpp synthetase/RelA/SpoT-type nucleotidyltranferase
MGRLDANVKREMKRFVALEPHLNAIAENLQKVVTTRLAKRWSDGNRPTPPAVYCRVKSRASVGSRIEERYSRLEDFPDLVGCRVVVLHSAEIDRAHDALRGLLDLDDRQEIQWYGGAGRSLGYSGCFWDGIPVGTLRKRIRLAEGAEADACKAELQIHTAMQEAWSRLSHERFYKSRVGVPHRTSLLLRRLAAVTHLVDEQFSIIEQHLSQESLRIQNLLLQPQGYESAELDEYVILLASSTWDELFRELRDLGQQAGFRRSEWSEMVRIGDETDLCISVCERTGILTLGQFLTAVRATVSGENAAERIAKLRAVVNATVPDSAQGARGRRYFDRPLFVFSCLRLLEFPDHIDGAHPLRANIKSALKRVALS